MVIKTTFIIISKKDVSLLSCFYKMKMKTILNIRCRKIRLHYRKDEEYIYFVIEAHVFKKGYVDHERKLSETPFKIKKYLHKLL